MPAAAGVHRLALAAAGRVADAWRVPGDDTAVCAQDLSSQTCARALLLTPPCPCLCPPAPAPVSWRPQVEEYADEVFDLLDNGAHMYFCGLKGMMPGILDMLQRVSKEKGRNFDEFVEGLKHKNQWHVSSVAGDGGREREREGPACCGWGPATGRGRRSGFGCKQWRFRLLAAHACRMCGQCKQPLTPLPVCCCLLETAQVEVY